MTRKEKGGGDGEKRKGKEEPGPRPAPAGAAGAAAAASQPGVAPRGCSRWHGPRHREDRAVHGPRTFLFVFLGLPQENNLKHETCCSFAAARVEKLSCLRDTCALRQARDSKRGRRAGRDCEGRRGSPERMTLCFSSLSLPLSVSRGLSKTRPQPPSNMGPRCSWCSKPAWFSPPRPHPASLGLPLPHSGLSPLLFPCELQLGEFRFTGL